MANCINCGPSAEPPIPLTTTASNLQPLPERISPEIQALYRKGIGEGNSENRFSKVGDSNTITLSFLGCFDGGADMNGWDIAIIVLLVAAAGGALYAALRAKKKKGSCCGDCTSCGGCRKESGRK